MYQSKCQFSISMTIKVDSDSRKRFYCYIAFST